MKTMLSLSAELSTESRPFHEQHQLTIGALAKACGVNVEGIRYYHRIFQSEDMPVQWHRRKLQSAALLAPPVFRRF